MCSLQNANVANFIYPSEQLEDDFITNLFSQNIATSYHDMDHDYAAQAEPSTVLPTWEESSAKKDSTSSLNMSTYFSTFDPSAQFQNNQLQSPLMQPTKQQSMEIHHASISLVPTAHGNYKGARIVKRKRKRTVFRTDQVEAMEEVFAKKPYVTKEDRKALVDRLQISDKSVKVWFQNRRLKNKRVDDFSDDENRSSPNLDRLDYVESKINERTNEFGYVTLDDRIMSDLVKVIDDYLYKPNTDITTKDIEIEETQVKMEIVRVPEYEPISPASTTDYSNEESSWECHSSDGNEYLQRLMDIETIISN